MAAAPIQSGNEQEQWALSGALLEFAVEGDIALVRRIITVFLDDTREKVELLQKAAFPADLAEARRIAHSMKGAARQIGTLRLAEAAYRLEHCEAENDAAAFSLLVTAIAAGWLDAWLSITGALER